MRALLRRFWSPAGFVLVGLCFLLPFVTVTVTVDVSSEGPIMFTGLDLAAEGRELMALTALGVVALGILVTALPWARVRTLGSAALALGALVALYAAYLNTKDVLIAGLRPLLANQSGDAPGLNESIAPSYGLIVAAVLVVIIGVANVDGWVRDRWKKVPPPSE